MEISEIVYIDSALGKVVDHAQGVADYAVQSAEGDDIWNCATASQGTGQLSKAKQHNKPRTRRIEPSNTVPGNAGNQPNPL